MVGMKSRDISVVSRTETIDVEGSDTPNPETVHDIFRKYFEAKFQPLEPLGSRDPIETEDDEGAREMDEDETDQVSDWSELSDAEEDHQQVEIVEHTGWRRTEAASGDKKAQKEFMNAKPLSLSSMSTTSAKSRSKNLNTEDDENTDALDLKNDLALQRLLKESHLLESASDLAPSGKNRHKAIDLRVQALGAKTSIYKQQKMPDSHRRGINAKAIKREENRWREAKENGIVLEKPSFRAKATTKRRERGVGKPSIGKIVGGTLHLSKRDLTHVKGYQRKPRGKSAKRGR